MIQHKQSLEDLMASLSSLDTDWKDDFAHRVMNAYQYLSEGSDDRMVQLEKLFDTDFDVALTIVRLFLEKSKDEMINEWRERCADFDLNKSCYFKNKRSFLSQFDHFMLRKVIVDMSERTYTWQDILTERLKAGRGSAIKGQARGRNLEDFVETIVKRVFGSAYDARCSFVGRSGGGKEKADFAIPSKTNPQVLIEVKAYGATGSKQTDVLGDVTRILEEKRRDTLFLLVTDGITWKDRANDLRKLINIQNKDGGDIYRIYTKSMVTELESDLEQIKAEKGL